MSQMNRERELFEQCLNLSDQEREDHLSKKCSQDADLKKRVLLLLRAHEQANYAGLALLRDKQHVSES